MRGAEEQNDSMRAWVVDRPGPIDDHPLLPVEHPDPNPEVRVRIFCCGLCRTDLHLAEGDRVGVAWLGKADGSCR